MEDPSLMKKGEIDEPINLIKRLNKGTKMSTGYVR